MNRGELTANWRAQNPDLIGDDNSDENLLEKIKVECEALRQKKTVKKKLNLKRLRRRIFKLNKNLLLF